MPALTLQLIGVTLAGASAAWLPTWLSRPVQISSAPPSPFSEDGCFNNSNECPVFSSRSSNDTVHVGYVQCLPPLNFGCPTLTCAPESCSAHFISLLHNRPEDWISNVVGQVAARNLAVVSGRRLRATAHLARTAINRCPFLECTQCQMLSDLAVFTCSNRECAKHCVWCGLSAAQEPAAVRLASK
jgi:hypothetical protein